MRLPAGNIGGHYTIFLVKIKENLKKNTEYYFDNPSYRPNKSNGVLEKEPRKIDDKAFDLMDRVEEDGFVTHNSKKDI